MTLASFPGEGYLDACPPSPRPEASEFSSTPYIPGTFQAAAPASLKQVEFVRPGTGPSRELPGTPEAFHIIQPKLHRFLQPDVMGTSFPSSGVPGWRMPCGAGTPCSSGGTSAAKVSLLISYHPLCVGPARSMSPPFLPLSMWLLLYVLGCRISVQLAFRWLSMTTFYNLVVILMWLWREADIAFTYVAIWIGSPFFDLLS